MASSSQAAPELGQKTKAGPESQPEPGSESLPHDADNGLSCGPADKTTSHTASPDRTFSILVAIGAVSERRILAELLTGEGYRVAFAENGDVAMARLGETPFDLVVASVVMQRTDGLELLRALAEMRSTVPVILLSPGNGKIDQVYLKCALLLGAAATHTQPLRPKAFLASVRKILANTSIRDEK
jgi:CheY-like chemotaxis protein